MYCRGVITHCKIRPKLCGNCAFPKNFHTKKLGEITVFFAVSFKGGSENSSWNEWSRTIVSFLLKWYTQWTDSLSVWPWLLELAWLPAPAKEAKGMSSSDSAASVGSSSGTVFRPASSISSFFFLIRTRTWKISLISAEYKVYFIVNIVILFQFHR